MGIYELCEGYELKGWRNVAYTLVNSEKRFMRKLNPRSCLFLMSCDGVTEQNDIPETSEFLRRGIIKKLDAPADKPCNICSYTVLDQLFRVKAQIAITGRCNLHCRHCLAADGDENVSTQLSLTDCERIFDEMLKNDIFQLWITGGEPLVHPDFRKIFEAAVGRGLRITSLFTNAWLVTDDLLEFIAHLGQKPEFVVSFDGLGTHDWMRNCKGAEKRTLEKIALIRRHGFPVRVGINVNSVTAPGVIDTCRTLVCDYDVTSLRAIYTSPTPRWDAALQQGISVLSPGDYYDLMIELLRASRVEGWGVSLDLVHMPKLHLRPKRPQTWDFLRTPPDPREDCCLMSSCGRASDVVFICSDGSVLPCSAYEGVSDFYNWFLGDDVNVLKTPLKQILSDSEYARQFDITLADLVQSDPACKDCKWLSVCCGGCPLYTLGRKTLDVGNPICMLYQGGYVTKYLDMLEETEALAHDKPKPCAEAGK